jgi:hypothetical protein
MYTYKIVRPYIILTLICHLLISIISYVSQDAICGYYPFIIACIHIPLLCVWVNNTFTAFKEYPVAVRYNAPVRSFRNAIIVIGGIIFFYWACDLVVLLLNALIIGGDASLFYLGLGILLTYVLACVFFIFINLFIKRGWLSILCLMFIIAFELACDMGLIRLSFSFFLEPINIVLLYLAGDIETMITPAFWYQLVKISLLGILTLYFLPKKQWGMEPKWDMTNT